MKFHSSTACVFASGCTPWGANVVHGGGMPGPQDGGGGTPGITGSTEARGTLLYETEPL